MKRIRALLPFVLILLVSVPAIIALYPRAFPLGGLRLVHDARSAPDASRAFLDSLSIDVDGLYPSPEFRINRSFLGALHRLYGIDSTNALILDGLPAASWEIRWRTGEPLGISRDNSETEARRVMESLKGQVSVDLAPDGRLLALEQKIADSARLATITLDDARRLAAQILVTWSALAPGVDTRAPLSEKTIVQPHRSDYEFVWNVEVPGWPRGAEIRTLIAGSTLAGLSTDLRIPEKPGDALESSVQVTVVVLYVAVLAFMVVSAFRRFRSFEIGFRLATIIGIVGAVVMGIEIVLSVQEEIGWGWVIALLLGPLFIGGGLALVWAVSESVGREAWKEKFVPLDLLVNGHFLHSRVGASIIRGMAMGALAAAVLLAGVAVMDGILPLRWEPAGDALPNQFEVAVPWLYSFGNAVYTSAFIFSVFILYTLSVLRRWVPSQVLLVTVAALVIGFARQGDLYPVGPAIVIQILVSLVFVGAFLRTDVLAAWLAVLVFAVVKMAGMFFTVGGASYEISGLALAGVASVVFAGSVAVQFRTRETEDFEAITPVFAHHITERQRLQQELEIAREVQMSFLPKENPRVPGLDIDSKCVPALEVGGDYFDFIRFGRDKVAVAVGDVSGKGTQAAFYMTLAKGFLRALSDEKQSAKTVLTHINRLFYDNVERGAFISMVYGMFDMKAKTVRLTRAGHNPVYVWKARKKTLEVLQPEGLALGLEDGKQFARTIREVRVPVARGDCFVFYTDGITEAMNKNREEYGDHRLADILRAHGGKPASEIIEIVLRDVRQFMGKEKQHDDMTMVVVRLV